MSSFHLSLIIMFSVFIGYLKAFEDELTAEFNSRKDRKCTTVSDCPRPDVSECRNGLCYKTCVVESDCIPKFTCAPPGVTTAGLCVPEDCCLNHGGCGCSTSPPEDELEQDVMAEVEVEDEFEAELLSRKERKCTTSADCPRRISECHLGLCYRPCEKESDCIPKFTCAPEGFKTGGYCVPEECCLVDGGCGCFPYPSDTSPPEDMQDIMAVDSEIDLVSNSADDLYKIAGLVVIGAFIAIYMGYRYCYGQNDGKYQLLNGESSVSYSSV